MSQIQSLHLLIHSMTLAEKKAFRGRTCRTRSDPNYLALFELIEKNDNLPLADLKKRYRSQKPGSSLETSARYLFELLLETLLRLRKDQDSFYSLFSRILQARVLYEKSLFDECFALLDEVMDKAQKFENYYALLLGSRLEMEYLLALNFPKTSEKKLLKKQFKINESLKYLRKINEQSSLFEILKHRIIYKGYPRSPKQKNELNDLVFSELSIVASQNLENFEIRKLHQLFQSNYLISAGDYKSAFHSYHELNTLFEANKHLWSTPPVYYLNMLEGVLVSLRGIHNYQGMGYFVEQLKKIESPSVDFRLTLNCLTFQYELFPLLDTGDFDQCRAHIKAYKTILYDKIVALDRVRQAELCLYTALVYLGLGEYRKAHQFLNQVILSDKKIIFLPIFRTVRLVNLIILYHLGESELIRYEIRSMKRDLRAMEKGYRIERLVFSRVTRMPAGRAAHRAKQWDKIKGMCHSIRQDIFEQQILHIFDFTAWIESQVLKVPLAEVMRTNLKTVTT